MVVDRVDRVAAAAWAVAVALFAAVVEMLGHPAVFGPWSPVPPLAAGALFAGLSTITPRRRQDPHDWVPWPAPAVARAASWLAAGGWVAYGYEWGLTGRYWHVRGWQAETWHTTYWQVGGFLALAAVAAAATYAMPTDLGQPMLPAAGPPPAAGPEVDPVTAQWQQIIADGSRGALPGAHSITVEEWETGNGYTVRGKLAGGNTWETLAKHTAGIAAVLDLDAGGGVSVEPDGPAAGFAAKVLVRDAMATPVAYPGTEEEG